MLSDVFHRNGVTEDHDRDPNSMGRPRFISTTGVAGGNNWSTGMYRYDGAGNITNIGDSAYTYDKVSRIKSASIPLTESPSGLWNPELALIFSDGFESGDTSAWGQQGQPTTAFQSFVYDAFGNLVEIVGTPGRTIAVNPATNRLSAPGTTHDAAGNVTAWSGNAYIYGPFNETWKTSSSGDEWIHLYDANDQRVWSFGVSGTGANRNRWTLRGFDDKVLREYTFIRSPASWTLERELIHRGPGQLLAAVLDGGGQRHYHLDHLGSPRLVTDASGAKVAFHSYFPYGEEATPLGQDGTRNKFTGHERDLGNAGSQADDLDYMHARYHNPLVGRFLSIDPAGSSAKLHAPQSWNRYSYARANPLKFHDPDGQEIQLAGGNSLVRSAMVEALRRASFREKVLPIAGSANFVVRVEGARLNSRAELAMADRRGQDVKVRAGTAQRHLKFVDGKPQTVGAVVQIDTDVVRTRHPDHTGVVTISHEIAGHVYDFFTGLTDKEVFARHSEVEAMGYDVLNEKPDLTVEEAEALLEDMLNRKNSCGKEGTCTNTVTPK